MKVICLVLIICNLFFYEILRAEEISLTLDEAIAIALRDNRDVLLRIEDVKKAKAKLAESKGGLLPTLSFTGTWADTRGLYAKDITSTTTQTNLKQYLYKGGKTINTIEQNRYKLEVSQALLDKARLETVLNVKKAFYTLGLAGELSGLNKSILDNVRAHLDFINARYLNGQASESEVLRFKDSLSDVREAYELSVNQRDSGLALLRNLLYLDEYVQITPEVTFSYEAKEIAYDEAFLEAIKARPEIRQYEAEVQASQKAIEIAKSDNRPNIYASWDYYSRSTTSLTFSPGKGWQDYNIIGVTFSWPIFDGWATQKKVEQAIIDLKETELLKEKVVKDIALELKNAYLDLKNAIIKIRTTQSEADLYQNTLSVTLAQYKAGIASLLELDDSSLGYAVSLFNQKQAIYDYVLAKARFEKAMGGM